MSKCTERNLCFLKDIHKHKGKKKKNLLIKASKDNIDSISEIASNVLKGNLKLNELNKVKLRKHADVIRVLAAKRTPLKKRKEILIQRGGFLPLLIAPFLTAIGSIAASVIARKLNL